MKRIFLNIIEFVLKIVRWDIRFYSINEKKVKKVKRWLDNHLTKMSIEQGLKIEIVEDIFCEREDSIILGQYYYKNKIVLNRKGFFMFSKYRTWIHELAHHFAFKNGIVNHDEKEIDDMVLPVIKTFPAWVVNTMSIEIRAVYDIDSHKAFMKKMGLTYYGIVKSERKSKGVRYERIKIQSLF